MLAQNEKSALKPWANDTIEVEAVSSRLKLLWAYSPIKNFRSHLANNHLQVNKF